MSLQKVKQWTSTVSMAGHHKGDHCMLNRTLLHVRRLQKSTLTFYYRHILFHITVYLELWCVWCDKHFKECLIFLKGCKDINWMNFKGRRWCTIRCWNSFALVLVKKQTLSPVVNFFALPNQYVCLPACFKPSKHMCWLNRSIWC